jgi:hypothetical protein
MFVDDMTGIGLWPDSTEFDDVDLPLPDDIRGRVQEWVEEYAAHIGDPHFDWTPEYIYVHDRRGYELSHEVGRALGDGFRLTYEFATTRLREEVKARRLLAAPRQKSG